MTEYLERLRSELVLNTDMDSIDDNLKLLHRFVSESRNNVVALKTVGTSIKFSGNIPVDAEGNLPNMQVDCVKTCEKYKVCDVSLVGGGSLQRHQHKELEILILIHGKIKVVVNGKGVVHTMTDGDVISIPPGVDHMVSYEQDSRLLAILIPGDLS